eukprot:CAMPEP_0172930736 /NCGR_PEP_ID=MMETSP1075-20121228/219131_1 /TAXON_ID=2916 /ORGANISM="Ceratium fusus, Strain PA161109" /LENGTH=760 /DNA_ID=CAMNT_0013792049 /DNA_START=122 /DNA_END=2407 /DNA_ORIENTATION=+
MSLHCPALTLVQRTGEAAADPGPGRQIDEVLWRRNCADFRDVMDIAKSVFLALEHHNEAALRVAVEVVTDPIARECLWWTDFWFEDDDQRDQWKHIIWEKFPVVIGHATDSKPMVQTAVSADPAALEGMQQRVEQADTACKAAQQQKKIAEMRCRELEEMETKSREHVRALDESLAQMRAELRRSKEACTSVQQRLALQEEQLHEAEKHKAAAAQCLAEQEKCARAAEDSFVADKEKLNKSEEARAVVEEKLKKSEEARAVLEEKLKKGEEARAVLEEKSKAAEEKIKALQASASMNTPSKSDDKALHEIAGKFHAEKALMREIGMQTEFHVEKALMREIEMQSEELRRKTKEQDAEVSELRKANAGLEREVEELRAKIPRKDERIGKLQEDKAALEEERMNMLRSIHALREKLKRITEIAEKKGYGKIVSEIMTEADIPQTLEGPEFFALTGFTRMRCDNAGLEREVEELRATIPQKDNRIGKLHEDKAALEEEKMNMLSSIHALREKLKRITEIAEKRGCGKLVSEIMAEANIPQTLEGREFRCFERLYQDALRRQRNVRDRMQSMVSAGSPTLGAGVPVVQPQLRVGPSVTAEGYGFKGLPPILTLVARVASVRPLSHLATLFCREAVGIVTGKVQTQLRVPEPASCSHDLVILADKIIQGLSAAGHVYAVVIYWAPACEVLCEPCKPEIASSFDADTAADVPVFLAFVVEGLTTGVSRRSRSPQPTDAQPKLTRSWTGPGNLPPLHILGGRVLAGS